MSVGIRYSIEEVKDLLLDMGYILLSKEYINDKNKIVFIDEYNYIYTSRLSNLLSGKIPQIVDVHNPYSIYNIKQYIINNEINVTLLSEFYTDSKIKLNFKCYCGNVFECSYAKFKSRHKYICNECSSRLKSENRKHKLEYIKLEYCNYGFIPLFDSYSHCEEKLLCQTKEGYKGYISYNNLISGCSFGSFKINNPFIIENIETYIKNNQLQCRLITNRIGNLNINLDFMCNCGNPFSTTWKSFVTNNISQCQRCSKKQSQYSIKIEELLKTLNLNYQKEYYFKDCKNISYLYFDYAIFINDIIILIEVDGELHYKIGYGGLEGLKTQQSRDLIKNEYCKKNKLTLIRIPYWEFNNDNYKNILLKGVNKIQLL